MSRIFQIKSLLSYWLEAVDEHSLHSPFFFDFYTRVIKPNLTGESFLPFETLREKLLHDERIITVQDLGAGSAVLTRNNRKIGDIAKTSMTSPQFSALYHRIIQYLSAQNIIELGTSLGINTLYLSQKADSMVTTFEGSSAISEIARITFELAGATNIQLIEGNIDTTLPTFLSSQRKIDFAFMDANHRYEPTKKYAEWIMQKTHPRSILILDDIHLSEDMQKAWNEIQNHKLVYATADLYRCGLVFFDPSLNKQHIVLQF